MLSKCENSINFSTKDRKKATKDLICQSHKLYIKRNTENCLSSDQGHLIRIDPFITSSEHFVIVKTPI